MNFKSLLTIPLLISLMAPLTNAESKTLSVENEFLKIVVNNTEQDTGRFAIETTGGNPDNELDDFQPLVYGRPIPWTSYTTILIDDTPYLFGGPSKKTARRTQTKLQFGTFIDQVVTNNLVQSTTQYDGIKAIQELRFHRNPNSRAKDTALIRYTLTNTDTVPHTVGARIMLDTKLGQNDGAPFRMGSEAITAEKILKKSSFYEYWQTFDNLSTPNVIAQGTIEQHGQETPDHIRLVNWGTLSDNPWEFKTEDGRSFIRDGEFEKDTALALYWQPVTLQPGESRTVQTLYGLANLSLSPGELSLGLTAPDQRHASNRTPFLMMAYILNSGGLDAHDTRITFDLPKGFEIVEGKKTTEIGLLKAGQTYQLPIKVRLQNARAGKHTLRVKVSSQSLDDNTIERSITLLAAPDLTIRLNTPSTKIIGNDPYTELSADITNETKLKIDNITTQLSLPKQLELPHIELERKKLKTLYPGQTKRLSWLVKTPSVPFHNLPISLSVDSPVTKKQQRKTSLSNQYGPSQMTLKHSFKSIEETPYFYTTVELKNPKTYTHKRTLISYNPDDLTFLRSTPVTPFTQNDNNTLSILKADNSISITQLTTTETTTDPLPVVLLHFKTKTDAPTLPKIDTSDSIVIE